MGKPKVAIKFILEDDLYSAVITPERRGQRFSNTEMLKAYKLFSELNSVYGEVDTEYNKMTIECTGDERVFKEEIVETAGRLFSVTQVTHEDSMGEEKQKVFVTFVLSESEELFEKYVLVIFTLEQDEKFSLCSRERFAHLEEFGSIVIGPDDDAKSARLTLNQPVYETHKPAIVDVVKRHFVVKKVRELKYKKWQKQK